MNISKPDFLRIMTDGPQNLQDALWSYLFTEGIFNVPISWHCDLVRHEIGRFVVAMIAPIASVVAGTIEAQL